MSARQQILLVALRTLIGWHFLYEGYFKLVTPGWGPDGLPLSRMVVRRLSARRHRAVRGHLSPIGASPWIGAIDIAVAVVARRRSAWA